MVVSACSCLINVSDASIRCIWTYWEVVATLAWPSLVHTVDRSSTRLIFNDFSSSRHSKFVTTSGDGHDGLLLSNQCLWCINQMHMKHIERWLQLWHDHLWCTVDRSSTRLIFNDFSSSRHSKFVTTSGDGRDGLLLSNQCLWCINQMHMNILRGGCNSGMTIFGAHCRPFKYKVDFQWFQLISPL